jgi:hypothetical protein
MEIIYFFDTLTILKLSKKCIYASIKIFINLLKIKAMAFIFSKLINKQIFSILKSLQKYVPILAGRIFSNCFNRVFIYFCLRTFFARIFLAFCLLF